MNAPAVTAPTIRERIAFGTLSRPRADYLAVLVARCGLSAADADRALTSICVAWEDWRPGYPTLDDLFGAASSALLVRAARRSLEDGVELTLGVLLAAVAPTPIESITLRTVNASMRFGATRVGPVDVWLLAFDGRSSRWVLCRADHTEASGDYVVRVGAEADGSPDVLRLDVVHGELSAAEHDAICACAVRAGIADSFTPRCH